MSLKNINENNVKNKTFILLIKKKKKKNILNLNEQKIFFFLNSLNEFEKFD